MSTLGSFDEVDALTLIRQLNETDEHSRCEAKTSSQLGRSLMETICAYANEPGLGGGFLILGVSREEDFLWPQYEVSGLVEPDKLQLDIASKCRSMFNRPIRPQIRVEQVHGNTVLVVYVPEGQPSEKPVYFLNDGLPRGAYRRIGSADHRCSEDDLIVFYGNQQVESFDRQVLMDSTWDDIDPIAVEHYRTLRAEIRPDAEELTWTDSDLLYALNCCKNTEKGVRPTVAGILLFGTKLALRRYFPMMRIDYVRVPTNEWVADPADRFDSLEIREPLARAVTRIKSSIVDDLPMPFSLPEGALQRESRPVLPDRVIREIVVNAVMHRCYRTHGPVYVIKYPNRIEVRNPGHSLVSDERLGQPGSETRNPHIAAALYEIGLAETKGSGLRAVKNLMSDAMLPPPLLESDREGNRFIASLLLHHFLTEDDVTWLANFAEHNLSRDDQLALIIVRELGAIDNSTYRNTNGVDTLTASFHLRQLRDLGLLEMKGKGARTHYRPTEYLLHPKDVQSGGLSPQSGGLSPQSGGLSPQSGGLSPQSGGLSPQSGGHGAKEGGLGEEVDMPEWVAESVAGLGKRARREEVRKVILELCAWKPLMPAEIAGFLNRSSVKRLVEDYISPLGEEGLLERTIPEKPSHPSQRYRTTALGSTYIV